MLLIIVRILYAFICAGAIATMVHSAEKGWLEQQPLIAFFVLMAVTQAATIVDWLFPRKRLDMISAIYFGLLVGMLLAYLMHTALKPVVVPDYQPLVLGLALIMLPYICISLLLQTKDDFRFLIPYVEFAKEVKGGRPLVVDSSSLIDGRIADVMDTHVLDTDLVVPDFVLREVQDIADSSDKIRRARGRRGLEVLSKLQQNARVDVRVYEVRDKEMQNEPVDQRIIKLAKRLGGRVITNDFNMNRVAAVQGVDVVNLNDVANALRPRYIPGEIIRLRVIREGESLGQGVGYLEDGTMVVCEGGANHVGREIEVSVTSVLQNSAGRMMFGRFVQGYHGRSDANPARMTAGSVTSTQDE